MDLVREVGLGKSDGGRKPMKLQLNHQKGYVLGLEISRSEVAVGVSDLIAPLTVQRYPVNMSEPGQAITSLVQIIRNVWDTHPGKTFLGVGLSIPGLIDTKAGLVRRSANLGPKWISVPLQKELGNQIGVPVFIDSAANAGALAEQAYGSGQNCSDMVYINVGEGISAGIMVSDQLLYGYHSYAGQIGHMVVAEDGALCKCGNRGCLEAVCGIPALLRKTASEMSLISSADPIHKIWSERGTITMKDLMVAAQVPGSYAYELFLQLSNRLGLAIANIVNVYDPQCVVIGGEVAKVIKNYLGELVETVRRHSFPEAANGTQIRLSKLSKNAEVYGACALVLRELLTSTQTDIFEQAARR